MKKSDMQLSRKEMAENPTVRIPICLVLDVSGSMTGPPIQQLNEGLRTFFDVVNENELTAAAVELSILSFGGTVTQVMNFGSCQRPIPTLAAIGSTPMGQAMEQAVELIENQVQLYQRVGNDYYKPWLVLMTDGAPTDDISQAVAKTNALVEAGRLTVFPVGVGDHADLETLLRISPKRPPVRMSEVKFVEFFNWLGQSVFRVSVSMPGDEVKLPPLDSWLHL